VESSIFITGTDTGIGKTVVAGMLLKFFRKNNINAITQKWVQTGNIEFSEDIENHFKIADIDVDKVHRKYRDMVPYIFPLVASPHLAAQEENSLIDKKKIKESFLRLRKEFDIVIVEGTGGFLVPINSEYLLADLVKEEKIPVLIVVGNKLGAINHTLLTVEAIKRRKLKILGIMFNRIDNELEDKIALDNMKIIKEITGENVFGEIKYNKNIEELYEEFISIAEKIFGKCR